MHELLKKTSGLVDIISDLLNTLDRKQMMREQNVDVHMIWTKMRNLIGDAC